MHQVRFTTHHPFGPVTLVMFSSVDADWIERNIKKLPVDLHTIQSAAVTLSHSFFILERQVDPNELIFWAQGYRPLDGTGDLMGEIHVDVFNHYPCH